MSENEGEEKKLFRLGNKAETNPRARGPITLNQLINSFATCNVKSFVTPACASRGHHLKRLAFSWYHTVNNIFKNYLNILQWNS